MTISPWKILESRFLINDRWLTLRADRCQTAGGVVLDPYYVQELPDWVQIVAFDSNNQVLINRQYRHALGQVIHELPCGTVEAGEPPEVAMRRELLEETGCSVESLIALPALYPNPSRNTNRVHGFVATGARQVQAPMPEPTEHIEFEFMPVSEILAMVDQGTFPQALHVATFMTVMRMRETRNL
jgi:8-oxo-dGTP pyrophosphatase MutT (NUDIX family)